MRDRLHEISFSGDGHYVNIADRSLRDWLLDENGVESLGMVRKGSWRFEKIGKDLKRFDKIAEDLRFGGDEERKADFARCKVLFKNIRSLQLERRKLYQEAQQLSCRGERSRSPKVRITRHATHRNPIIHRATALAPILQPFYFPSTLFQRTLSQRSQRSRTKLHCLRTETPT